MQIDKVKADKFRKEKHLSMAEISLLVTDGTGKHWYNNHTAPCRSANAREVTEAEIKRLAKYLDCEPSEIVADETETAQVEPETNNEYMERVIRLLTAILLELRRG